MPRIPRGKGRGWGVIPASWSARCPGRLGPPLRGHSPDSQGDRQLMHLSTTFQTWVNVLSSQGAHTVSMVLVHNFFIWWPKETRASVVSAGWGSAGTPGSSTGPR